MEISILLARIIGPTFLVIGLGALINPIHYSAMISSFTRNAPLYYFSGALALITGIAILLFHNIWVADWRVAITLIGWISVVKGIGRIVVPMAGVRFSEKMNMSNNQVAVAASVIGLFGIWLSLKGYAF